MIINANDRGLILLPSGRLVRALQFKPIDADGRTVERVRSIDTATMVANVHDKDDLRITRDVPATGWTWQCGDESGAWDALLPEKRETPEP